MTSEIDGFIAVAESIAVNVDQAFGSLDGERLNWKPDARSWSIGQCLEHLIITNKLEFPAIEKALQADYRNPFWSKMPFLPVIFGKSAIYLFSPENSRKIRAPKRFQPAQSRIDAAIVKDFVAHQQEVTGLFEKSRNLDLGKIKIVSPVTDLITYSLHDAYKVLMVHEERHFRQAERVLKNSNFPK